MTMSTLSTGLKIAVAGAVVGLLTLTAAPSSAADLNTFGRGGGSLKDGTVVEMRPGAGPCYLRGDTGYSASQLSDMTITQTQISTGPVTEKFNSATLSNTWLLEGGVGCSWGGSRGIRLEGVIGMHGDRTLKGNTPGVWGTNQPMEAKLQTYTAMVNLYKDFGNFAGFIPYVGGGVGVAFNDVSKVKVPGADWANWHTFEGGRVGLAWSVMAGVGYQISERAILDVGYRYLNMGKAGATFTDTCFYVPTCGVTGQIEAQNLKVSENAAHEFKVGLRYHFGGDLGGALDYRR